MAWVRVDDKFTRGRKVKRAARLLGGKRARRRVIAVWLDAMSYCNLHLTDGVFPDDELTDLDDENPSEVFAAMAHGDPELGAIVERGHDAWVFRNYADYQPTKADVEAKLEKDRKRKRGNKDSAELPRGGNTDSERTGPNRTEPARTDRPDQTEEPQDQDPAASRRPLRIEFKALSDIEPMVRKAVHDYLDANPDAPDGDLVDTAKIIAARSHAVGYKGHEITALIDAVRATRARRSA